MNKYFSLDQLLAVERDANAIQGLRNGKTLSWQYWRQRVLNWQTVLQAHSGKTWALYHSDAVEFSAILFALWASEKVACVPGSNQTLIVESLAKRVDGFIGEFESDSALFNSKTRLQDIDLDPSSDKNLCSKSQTFEAVQLDSKMLAMEVFTSGSTGEPQAIPKYLHQLIAEVNNLEKVWGSQAGQSLTLATVNHHHIYGLLFRVLWALSAGRCFEAEVCEFLEDIHYRAADWDSFLLISSPTHLTRLPEKNDWSRVTSHCRGIFSSGAPLPRDSSLHVAAETKLTPIEVFGSSETGGIAWRQQAFESDTLWGTFPGIQISTEEDSQCLQIQSPYLPSISEWYVTSDKVELIEKNKFKVIGRVDRIAKIEGKRVSLTEMETALLANNLIDQARVVVITGKRTEVGVVAVLSAQGLAELNEKGKRVVNLALQDHLQQQFERPVVPRRWRYLSELPRDSQGKITQQNLLDLFSKQVEKKVESRPELPLVRAQELAGAKLTLQIEIQPNLIFFDGHFEQAAILPGVVQIRWAKYFGETMLGFVGEFSHLEAIKFQQVIRPGQLVTVDLEFNREKNKLAFSYHSEVGAHSSGRIVNRINESVS
ncbi:acyl-CoA synthetase family protein [Aurantivibrio infirmus]